MRRRPHSWRAPGGCSHPPHCRSRSRAWWAHSSSLLLLLPGCLTPIISKFRGSLSSLHNNIKSGHWKVFTPQTTAPNLKVQSLLQRSRKGHMWWVLYIYSRENFIFLYFQNRQKNKNHIALKSKRNGDQNIQAEVTLGKGFQHLAGMCCATKRFFILFWGGLKIAGATLQGGFICGRIQSGQVCTSSSPLPSGAHLTLLLPTVRFSVL